MINSKYACIVDKDNTLFDNNKVYANAQIEGMRVLSQSVSINPDSKEEFKIQRMIDKRIAERFGSYHYPAKIHSLALYMYFSSQVSSIDDAAKAALNWNKPYPPIVIAAGEAIERKLDEMPEIYPGAYEVLEYLHKKSFMLMVTGGAPKRHIPTIEQNRLGQYFDSMVIIPNKTFDDVRRAKELAMQYMQDRAGNGNIWLFEDLVDQLSYGMLLGMRTVCIRINSQFEDSDIFGNKLEALPRQPDFFATSMHQLLEYLKTQMI